MTRYIKRRACRECGKRITGRRPHAVYCTAACRRAYNDKLARERYVPVRHVRACADCSTDISERHANATRCEACQLAHRSARPRGKLVERSCQACGSDIRGRARDVTVCAICAAARVRDLRRAELATRECERCGDSIGHRGAIAVYCEPCAADPARLCEQIGEWAKANPVKVWYWNIRRRARDDGREFTITLEDVQVIWPAEDSHCGICGCRLTRAQAEPDCPSIDRIDNSAGYVPGNIHVCCLGCNGRKGRHSLTELANGDAGPGWQRWALSVLTAA